MNADILLEIVLSGCRRAFPIGNEAWSFTLAEKQPVSTANQVRRVSIRMTSSETAELREQYISLPEVHTSERIVREGVRGLLAACAEFLEANAVAMNFHAVTPGDIFFFDLLEDETLVTEQDFKTAAQARYAELETDQPRLFVDKGDSEDCEYILMDRRLSDVADALRKIALPSVRLLEMNDAQNVNAVAHSPGASRLGGRPDLPPGVAWPQYALPGTPPEPDQVNKYEIPVPASGRAHIPFLGQINLSETSAIAQGTGLPDSGRLYFFWETRFFESREGTVYPSEMPEATRVLFHQGDEAKLIPTEPPESLRNTTNTQFAPVSLVPRREMTIPAGESLWFAPEYSPVKLTAAQVQAYLERDDRNGFYRVHRLAGFADESYTLSYSYDRVRPLMFPELPDPQTMPAKERFEEYAKVRLLLQLEEFDRHLSLGRSYGRLFFFIREEDLARQDFSRVWAVVH